VICERCDQEIETGELYHKAYKAGSDEGDANFQPLNGSVTVHDFPCPTRFEVRDGHVYVNGADIGPESMYSASHPAINSAKTAAAFVEEFVNAQVQQ